MKINVIVSYSNNLVIGNDNKRLWNYDEEKENFQKIVSDRLDISKKNILIYGQRSYMNSYDNSQIRIVITTLDKDALQNEYPDTYFVDSFGSCMDKCKQLINDNIAEKIFVCGGESIYKYFFKSYFYKYLDKVYITYINKTYNGNKFFYGLESHFLYTNIKKSTMYPEIEYRELQHDKDFINPENTFLDYLRQLTQIKLEDEISYFEFDIILDLTKYFPVFEVVRVPINDLLPKILLSIKSIKDIEDRYMTEDKDFVIDLYDIKPFESKYFFTMTNDKLSLSVHHKTGNILNEVLYNILFSSLLLTLISKLKKCCPYLITYKCEDASVNKNQIYNIGKIAWTEPTALPIIEIKDRSQTQINDFYIDDIIILG